jgi:plasmid stabilization system protein ParE
MALRGIRSGERAVSGPPPSLVVIGSNRKDPVMARGSKAKYTSKQKRRAEHIEEGYENRGTSSKEAARRAWATVNKESGGGKKSGSGRGKKENRSASRKGGRKGAASRSSASRSAAAKKAARTRARRS